MSLFQIIHQQYLNEIRVLAWEAETTAKVAQQLKIESEAVHKVRYYLDEPTRKKLDAQTPVYALEMAREATKMDYVSFMREVLKMPQEIKSFSHYDNGEIIAPSRGQEKPLIRTEEGLVSIRFDITRPAGYLGNEMVYKLVKTYGLSEIIDEEEGTIRINTPKAMERLTEVAHILKQYAPTQRGDNSIVSVDYLPTFHMQDGVMKVGVETHTLIEGEAAQALHRAHDDMWRATELQGFDRHVETLKQNHQLAKATKELFEEIDEVVGHEYIVLGVR